MLFNMTNTIIEDLKDGKLPEIPFSVSVEKDSIVRLAMAELIVGIILILIAALLRNKK